MPFESVAVFRKPWGRWHAGALYEYSKHSGTWRWLRKMAEEDLSEMEHQCLTLARQAASTLPQINGGLRIDR